MDEFLLLSLRNLGKKTYHLAIPRKDLSWHHCLHNNFKYILTLIQMLAKCLVVTFARKPHLRYH